MHKSNAQAGYSAPVPQHSALPAQGLPTRPKPRRLPHGKLRPRRTRKLRHCRYRGLNFRKTYSDPPDLEKGTLASVNPNVTIFITVSKVPGPEPPAPEDTMVRFRIIEIATADGRTLYEDLANLPGREILSISLTIRTTRLSRGQPSAAQFSSKRSGSRVVIRGAVSVWPYIT